MGAAVRCEARRGPSRMLACFDEGMRKTGATAELSPVASSTRAAVAALACNFSSGIKHKRIGDVWIASSTEKKNEHERDQQQVWIWCVLTGIYVT